MITNQQKGTRSKQLFELLQSIEVLDTREEKLDTIKGIVSRYPAFNDYVRCIFDENILFNLPEGRPPYTPSSEAHPTSWNKEHMRLPYFVKGSGHDDMNPVKRESMWIQLLEGIHPEDAVLIADMTDRRLPRGSALTKELLNEAVPGLIR